jgi:hypothetical protein
VGKGSFIKGIQDQLASAITTCDENIFRYIGGNTIKDDIGHKLIVHIWIKTFLRKVMINFITQIIIIRSTSYWSITRSTSNKSNILIKRNSINGDNYKFSSDYIDQQVDPNLNKNTIENFLDMDAILDGGESNPVLGRIFEQIAHRALWNGGTFKHCSFDTNYEDSIAFSITWLILFTQIDEIQNVVYSVPLDKSFLPVDAILQRTLLLKLMGWKEFKAN